MGCIKNFLIVYVKSNDAATDWTSNLLLNSDFFLLLNAVSTENLQSKLAKEQWTFLKLHHWRDNAIKPASQFDKFLIFFEFIQKKFQIKEIWKMHVRIKIEKFFLLKKHMKIVIYLFNNSRWYFVKNKKTCSNEVWPSE